MSGLIREFVELSTINQLSSCEINHIFNSMKEEIASLKAELEEKEKHTADTVYIFIADRFTAKGRYKLANWLAHGMRFVNRDDNGVFMTRKDYKKNNEVLYVGYDGSEKILPAPPEE